MGILTYIVLGFVGVFVLLLCFALAVASFSFENYTEKLKENNNRRNTYGITTLDYVNEINEKYFNSRLNIARCAEYEDHYSSGKISLSEKTMSSNSLASIAIVSHELGHAKQDFGGDRLQQHWKLRRKGKTCGLFFMPLLISGAIMSILSVFDIIKIDALLYVGLGLLALCVFIFFFAIIVKYKEIQIEKEASNFALEFIREYLTDIEVKYCKEFLDSARLTYWAGLFRTMFSWTFLTGSTKMFK